MNNESPEWYRKLTEEQTRYALLIKEYCPDCRERSLALTKLEEAFLWAREAITRNT